MYAIAGALALTSCAIQAEGGPSDISPEQAVDFGAFATGDAATGERSIYLLTPAGNDGLQQLRAVRRNTSPQPQDLLDSLLAGANAQESSAGLTSAIPLDLAITEARTVGTRLTIDINTALDELSEVALLQALAQIVATASEIEPVQQIRLRVDGENRSWPTADGDVTDRPLSIYDYPGFLESSQPPFAALPTA